ncbi:MAG: hypothetical protein ACREEV_20155 [Dongiaceae bacterium]
MTRAAPARRLLARLVDEEGIESEPIAEVRADLAALGIDPARTIALSRRLAASSNSPAATLLRRVSESEADDDEIRRLEQMEIGAVRQSLPEGVAAATVARARRATGIDSNVVSLRRRRSRRLLYGLSGVAAAMAASLVFYVGLSNNQPFRLEAPQEVRETAFAPQPVAPAVELKSGESRLNQPPAAEADAAKSELADTAQQQFSGGGIQAANEPAASGTQSAAQSAPSAVPTTGTDEAHPALLAPRGDQQASADTADMQRQREALIEELEKATAANRLRAESEQSNQPQPGDLTSAATGAATTPTSAAAPPLPAPEMAIIPKHKPDFGPSEELAAGTTDRVPTERAREAVQSVAIDAAAPKAPPAAPFGLAHPVVALLIVDPGSAPPGLHQKDFPVGTLPTRLGEARRLAEGRIVAALVTLRVGDRVVDAIISESRASRALSTAEAVPDTESATLGPVLPGYELIEFDRR